MIHIAVGITISYALCAVIILIHTIVYNKQKSTTHITKAPNKDTNTSKTKLEELKKRINDIEVSKIFPLYNLIKNMKDFVIKLNKK
jgi:hypothetical protein